MNTKRLKSVVKYVWQRVCAAVLAWSHYRPSHCALCEKHEPCMRLPWRSTHPGRGMWVCQYCVYNPERTKGDDFPRGHINAPMDAMRFRDTTSRTLGSLHTHADLAPIWGKRTKLVQSECRPQNNDEA